MLIRPDNEFELPQFRSDSTKNEPDSYLHKINKVKPYFTISELI